MIKRAAAVLGIVVACQPATGTPPPVSGESSAPAESSTAAPGTTAVAPEVASVPAPAPSPAPSASTATAPAPSASSQPGQCASNADCPKGYHCAQGVPLRGRCWKDGTPEPICLASTARIATPSGDVAARDVVAGMRVWTVGANGERIAATVVRTSRAKAPPAHSMARVELDDGRVVRASPRHPTCGANAVPLGDVAAGAIVDGARVRAAARVPYGESETFDLLPEGPTGCYWADGVLLGSTLR